MITLTKNGLVRTVETELEAEFLTEQGYEAVETEPETQEGADKFSGFTVPELVELCKEKGIEIPKGTTKRADFIALILSCEEG